MSSPKPEYFSQLNYTLANEDTAIELHIARASQAQHVLAICGSGGRALPLAAAGPASLTCLDLSIQQLWLATLRLATMRTLDFQNFCLFWGFPPYQPENECDARRQIFAQLPLENTVRDFFQALLDQHQGQGLLYQGGWERSIIAVPQLLRPLVGRVYDKIFDGRDLASQTRFMQDRLDSFVWKIIPKLVLRVFGNAAYFNAKLYKGRFVRKNIPEPYYDFYRRAFHTMFATGLNRENFFLQLVFLGRLRYPEGNPVEAQPTVFSAAQSHLRQTTQVHFVQDSVFDFAARSEARFDFVSLSDVPSYLEGERERDYMQKLRVCLTPGAIVVSRCYLRVPEQTDFTGYEDITSMFRIAIARDKLPMYQVFVHRYCG